MAVEDEVVTRDVEAQPHPEWFVEHKELLCIPQEKGENVFDFFILKVVSNSSQPAKAFTPYQFRYGLHNRETLAGKLDILGPEGLKLSIAQALGLGGEWEDFCNYVVKNDEISSVFTCYGLRKGTTSWRNDQIQHVLALDALFLAISLREDDLLWTRLKESIPNDSNNAFHSSLESHWEWQNDLFKVENQIPFVFIRRVFEYFTNNRATSELQDGKYLGVCMAYGEIIVKSFMDVDGKAFKDEESSSLKKSTHILGAAYEAICGHNRLKADNTFDEDSEDIRIPSASKLMASGITIKGHAAPLCTMSYENKCLSLPKMKIYDDTTSFIRNMAYYEYTFVNHGCLFHDYVYLILDLIKTPGDLEALIEAKVIENGCGERAFKMLKTLDEGLDGVPPSTKHSAMKARIEKRCSRRRYRLWSEFKEQFCSKPWLVMSTIAITLVTLATLLQTYTAIIGSHRMKPQFNS